MNPKYFDIHAHVQFPEFDTDRPEVLKRAREAGVGMINIATGVETSLASIKLAEENEGVYAAVGFHPCYISEAEFDYEKILELAKNPKVVVIGECGIDLFHNNKETLNKQIEIFKGQLEIAKLVNKPVMLHLRNSKDGESAYRIALEILKKFPEIKANAHFFAGTIDEAKFFFAFGHTISFTGAITYKNSDNYAEVIKLAPLENIMCETDCPFVAPVPHRGERNEPSFVIEVYKKIAEIKNLSLEQVINQVRENVRRVFSI